MRSADTTSAGFLAPPDTNEAGAGTGLGRNECDTHFAAYNSSVLSGRPPLALLIPLYAASGKMQKLSEMSSGSFFGEVSLIRNEPRSAYIIALTPVYVRHPDESGGNL